jgi:hypothetical protein
MSLLLDGAGNVLGGAGFDPEEMADAGPERTKL